MDVAENPPDCAGDEAANLIGILQSGRAIRFRELDEPDPGPSHDGSVRREIFHLLARLRVRQCVEIDRKKRTMTNYIALWRKLRPEYANRKFRLRVPKYGWTKLWRIE